MINLSQCYVCSDLSKNINILPCSHDYIENNFLLLKNTYIVKNIDNYKFLYYYICNNCIDNYLKKYSNLFRYIRNREIGL